MKYEELSNKSVFELADAEAKLRDELFHLNLKAVTNQLEKKHRIRELRRDIARVRTKLGELERKQQKRAG